MVRSFGIVLAFLGIIIGLLALSPKTWLANLGEWGHFARVIVAHVGLVDAILFISIAALFYVHIRRDVTVRSTRSAYWSQHIESIIAKSDRLVVLDSYQGHKHEFWTALEERVKQPKPFQLVIMMLAPDDWFWKECRRIVQISDAILEVDRTLLASLLEKLRESPYRHNKKIELYTWTGFSPGPLIAWTIGARERIAVGLWVNDPRATDGTPYLIVSGGPLLETMRGHYQRIMASSTTYHPT